MCLCVCLFVRSGHFIEYRFQNSALFFFEKLYNGSLYYAG